MIQGQMHWSKKSHVDRCGRTEILGGVACMLGDGRMDKLDKYRTKGDRKERVRFLVCSQ